MSERDTVLLLEDILESAAKIRKYTNGLDFEAFQNEEMIIDAVVRNFEIIGEAANRIPPEIREENYHIEWNRIRGFRNRIVHAYFGINTEIVWEIINNYLDVLVENVEQLKDDLKLS